MELIEMVKECVLIGGRIILQHFGNLLASEIEEKAKNDLVTIADRESEEAIKEYIWKHFPDHDILAEESGLFERKESYRWIIDPLDGTRNYTKGLPVFAVSVAVEFNGELIAGAVYDPIKKELFWAEKGKGAFVNNERIRVSSTTNISEALIGTGFPFKAKEYIDVYLQSFREVFIAVSGVRRLGAASLDLCYTARGIFDGFWELFLSPWDVAAGALIIKEAGGIVSDVWGKDEYLRNGHIVGANPYIYSQLQKILENSLKDLK
jgi:myo-inositol-1(or 4)-monophosphatase